MMTSLLILIPICCSLQEELESLDELKMIVDDAGGDHYVLSESQLKRLERLQRRLKIKESNALQNKF